MKVNEQTFLLAIWQHIRKALNQCPPFPPLNPLKGYTKRFNVTCSLQGYTKMFTISLEGKIKCDFLFSPLVISIT